MYLFLLFFVLNSIAFTNFFNRSVDYNDCLVHQIQPSLSNEPCPSSLPIIDNYNLNDYEHNGIVTQPWRLVLECSYLFGIIKYPFSKVVKHALKEGIAWIKYNYIITSLKVLRDIINNSQVSLRNLCYLFLPFCIKLYNRRLEFSLMGRYLFFTYELL